MTNRFMQDLPEGVTVGSQVDFLIRLCDDMIKQTGWVRTDGDVTIQVTARRLVRFLNAARERLLSLPRDGDPAAIWTPRDMQALLWAIGVETPINFDETEEEG